MRELTGISMSDSPEFTSFECKWTDHDCYLDSGGNDHDDFKSSIDICVANNRR